MKSKNKIPIELYLHIPFCIKKCDYCDFLSFSVNKSMQFKYITALMKEISYYADLMEDYEIISIYIGGGTPSIVEQEWMLRLLDVVGETFDIRPDAEVTMECNPGTMTGEKLQAYREAGVNRLSIGLQSTDDHELEILGRVHTYKEFLAGYHMARECGFKNINVDLISGIPHQNLESWARNLLRVIQLKPEHISAYSLIIEENTPFWRKYKYDLNLQQAGLPTREIPSEEEAYKMMKATEQLLDRHGYKRYEISNYCRPGYECRHNLGYWDRTQYLGLGLGAASLIGNIRYKNLTDLSSYIKGTSHIFPQVFTDEVRGQKTMGMNLHEEAITLTRKEQMEEFMFLGLRRIKGVSSHDFFHMFDIPIEAIFQRPIERLKKEGLLEQQYGIICLTNRGLDVSNYAMSEFLLD